MTNRYQDQKDRAIANAHQLLEYAEHTRDTERTHEAKLHLIRTQNKPLGAFETEEREKLRVENNTRVEKMLI